MIALSGGIDSALVALIAVDALGPGARQRRRHALPPLQRRDPGRRPGDRREPRRRADRDLDRGGDGGLRGMRSASSFEGAEPGLAEENLQARIRGNLVMALSNKFGWLVLTTGNKSEMSVGYATLYGDMAGGFAVIKDVPKMLVYRLVRWRNEQEGRELIPASVLERPPSAELRPDQLDEDSLPPYETARPDPRGLRRARRGHRCARRAGSARGDRPGGRPAGRPRRVQAPPGTARDPGLDQGLRPRPAPADHQPFRLDEEAAPLAAARGRDLMAKPSTAGAEPRSSSGRGRRPGPRRRSSRHPRPRSSVPGGESVRSR